MIDITTWQLDTSTWNSAPTNNRNLTMSHLSKVVKPSGSSEKLSFLVLLQEYPKLDTALEHHKTLARLCYQRGQGERKNMKLFSC